MKIVVVGIGYVGLSNAILLSCNHDVTIVDISSERVDLINKRISPFADGLIQDYFKKELILKASLVNKELYKDCDLVIIATPTDYDTNLNYFDTSSVDNTVSDIMNTNPACKIIIKSTVPVGYTRRLSSKYCANNIYFAPEFLREGSAIYDNLHPSRIILGVADLKGTPSQNDLEIINLFKSLSLDKDTPTLIMGSTEAEAVKLFANTYLAMRVAYFNELDTYAEMKGLNTADIIKGIAYDPRIGDFYNNPSFGYGGYCLPKDTKQLNANFNDVPNQIISSTVLANETRKNFITQRILSKINKGDTIGVYRLTMKTGSDNFRSSSMISIIEKLLEHNVDIVIYEPALNSDFLGIKVVNNLNEFKKASKLIVANRYSSDLDDVKDKVYTRDIFKRD